MHSSNREKSIFCPTGAEEVNIFALLHLQTSRSIQGLYGKHSAGPLL
jgi:hypothetical protein